jgi:hypothetical protein
VALKVTDATGAPVAGASVGGAVSGADGTVVAGPFADRGDHDLKATKDGAIRSNRVRVCVSDGADGWCGTHVTAVPPIIVAPADKTAPTAKLIGIKDKHKYNKRGPRKLRGSFADPSGIKQVKLRLKKKSHRRCWYFSGSMEKFRRTGCGKEKYFAIGDKADWSYLLPRRLGKGRYTLEAVAIDGAGNRTPLARGTTKVVFTVR